jgi:hypothetical protein
MSYTPVVVGRLPIVLGDTIQHFPGILDVTMGMVWYVMLSYKYLYICFTFIRGY